MRLIDADALVKDIEDFQKSVVFLSYGERIQFDDMIDFAVDHLEEAPTIDAVPVVHDKRIGTSFISVKNIDEWQGRIILKEVIETHNCAVYYQDAEDVAPRWVSVKDRLPNKTGEYLASSNEYVITLEFDGGKWHDFGGSRYFVDAWMEKPEGYKPHDWDGDPDE